MKGKFVIAEPCHEKWDEMTQVEKGRFCASCAKCVFDFTSKTEEDILETYTANNGNVCGRFRRGQVEVKQQRPARRGMRRGALRRLQLFAAALLMIFGMGDLQAQTAPDEPMILGGISYHEAFDEPGIDVQVASMDEVLSGELILKDEQGNELERLMLSGPGTYSFYTRGKGRFTVTCKIDGEPEEMQEVKLKKEDILLFFEVGPYYDLGVIVLEPPLKEPIEPRLEPTPDEIREPREPVEELQLAVELNVFPNPTPDQFRVKLESRAMQGQLRLTDMQGRQLQVIEMERGRLKTDEIDLSGLPDGVYILHWSSETEQASVKVVKGS